MTETTAIVLWLCDRCIGARGGPSRIGPELGTGTLGGRCSDCGGAWCLWCTTLDESKAKGHRRCVLPGAPAVVSCLRPFRVPEVDRDAPTVPDLAAAARAADSEP